MRAKETAACEGGHRKEASLAVAALLPLRVEATDSIVDMMYSVKEYDRRRRGRRERERERGKEREREKKGEAQVPGATSAEENEERMRTF